LFSASVTAATSRHVTEQPYRNQDERDNANRSIADDAHGAFGISGLLPSSEDRLRRDQTHDHIHDAFRSVASSAKRGE
jgi:hypothetical protein